MFEYNYEIIRNEEDSIVKYIPDKIPKKIPNLVYIEGPNSSGKSTLLNIIALGLYGLKKENMAPALKHKLNSLLDDSYQKLTFNLKIPNKDGSLIMESKKENPDKPFTVYEIKNGKKVSLPHDRFDREYNLIYDIPENPTDRLNQLTLSIKELQNDKLSRFRFLRSHISTVIGDVKNSRDPKRIGGLRKEIEARKKDYEKYTEKIRNDSELLDLLEQYTYCKYYLKYFEEEHRLNEKIGKLTDEKTSIKSKVKKDNKKLERLTKKAQEEKYKLIDLHSDLVLKLDKILSKEDAEYIKYLRDSINLDDIFQKAAFPEHYMKILLNMQTNLIREMADFKNKEAVEEATIWDRIINILDEYKTTDFIVPGIEAKIADFIKILKKANEKNEKLLQRVKDLDNISIMIDVIKDTIKTIEKEIFPELKIIKEDNGIDILEDQLSVDEEIKILNKKIEEITSLCDEYYRECVRKNIPDDKIESIYNHLMINEIINPFMKYDETALLEKINTLQKNLQQDKKDQGSAKRYIDLRVDEVKRLEEKKPHKYQEKIDELTELLQTCQLLEQKFVNYNKYIADIINKKYTKDNSEEKSKYLAQVSTYLGRRIGYIRYIDNEYTVTSIDMVKEIIITEEGKKIRFVDMGTGQSQSAYLMGKLNTSDDKKIIALFDEVAMMDEKSLKPIFDRLKELYKSDKLLLGIVVQMGQEMNVKDLSKW